MHADRSLDLRGLSQIVLATECRPNAPISSTNAGPLVMEVIDNKRVCVPDLIAGVNGTTQSVCMSAWQVRVFVLDDE